MWSGGEGRGGRVDQQGRVEGQLLLILRKSTDSCLTRMDARLPSFRPFERATGRARPKREKKRGDSFLARSTKKLDSLLSPLFSSHRRPLPLVPEASGDEFTRSTTRSNQQTGAHLGPGPPLVRCPILPRRRHRSNLPLPPTRPCLPSIPFGPCSGLSSLFTELSSAGWECRGESMVEGLSEGLW